MSKPIAYADLHSLSENQQIRVIADAVTVHKQTVAVALENERPKIDRYRRKLEELRPGLMEMEECPGLVPNTIVLRVKPKAQNPQQN